MNHSDKGQFQELFEGLSAMYQKTEKLSKMALQVYFGSLEKYTIDQVIAAASRHVADSKHGTFYPKPADLIRFIEGGDPTHDEILSAARQAKTPLGILCRIQIGHWDLEHSSDMFYMKQRAQECIDLMPEWKAKAALGDYTDHECSRMLIHGVNPAAPFMQGILPPANTQQLENRCIALQQTERYKMLAEPAHKPEDGDGVLKADDSLKDYLRKLDI